MWWNGVIQRWCKRLRQFRQPAAGEPAGEPIVAVWHLKTDKTLQMLTPRQVEKFGAKLSAVGWCVTRLPAQQCTCRYWYLPSWVGRLQETQMMED